MSTKGSRISTLVFLALAAFIVLASSVGEAAVCLNPANSAPGDSAGSSNQPTWMVPATLQAGARASAGGGALTAILPFLLVAIIVYYVGVRPKNGFRTELPEAALWTTAAAAAFSVISNFAVAVPNYADPIPSEYPTSAGISASNLVLSLVAAGLTVAALVKQ